MLRVQLLTTSARTFLKADTTSHFLFCSKVLILQMAAS